MNLGDRLRRAWWNVPLGWQLGSLYAGLLVTILLAGGTLLYTQLDSFLVANTAARLRETARPLLNQPYFAGGDHGPNSAAPPSRARQDQVASTLVRRLSGPEVSVVVLDATGQVISSTAGLAE